jgi:hypothetical protein
MAAGGLLAGFWQDLDDLALAALFYDGVVNRPVDVRPLMLMRLIGVQLFFLLSPVVLAAWLAVRYLRHGRSLPTDVAPARPSMPALAAALLCAWVAVNLWICYLRLPGDFSLHSPMTGVVSGRWGLALTAYASNFQWLWPAGLAALAVFVAPARRKTGDGPQPIPA